MARIALSILLGVFTLVVFIGVGESLESRGPVIATMAAAGLAVALYLMIAEFLVAPRGSRGLRGKWPTMIAMVSPVLAICLLMIVPPEGGRKDFYPAVLVLVSACLGILIGAAVAGRVTFRAVSTASGRNLLLASAALVAAVAIVLFVQVIPLTVSAGTFPDGTPGATVPVLWGIAGLNALVAACLGFFGFRVGSKDRSTFDALAFLAFLTFMSACSLAPPAFAFRGHGLVLLIASNLALFCLVAEIVVSALVGSAALRLPEKRAA
jgi:hypothetical protein